MLRGDYLKGIRNKDPATFELLEKQRLCSSILFFGTLARADSFF